MCYSAMVWQEYQKYARAFGTGISIEDYVRIYWSRARGGPEKWPKGMDAAFLDPTSDSEGQHIAPLVSAQRQADAARLEKEIFTQRKRLADAERSLAAKPTRKSAEDRRIASTKVSQLLGRLADLRRNDPMPRDARIFPGWYAHVMVSENGQRMLKPMRYRCRLPGWTESVERKFPGTYMARRDRLEQTWSKLFGHHHGLVAMTRFYEVVERPDAEGRMTRLELEFEPRSTEPMLVACLWSRTPTPDGDLLSFAAISDEPPPEVMAAGHDRCPIPIRATHIDAWLNPESSPRHALHTILEDRERPYYEHRIAQAA